MPSRDLRSPLLDTLRTQMIDNASPPGYTWPKPVTLAGVLKPAEQVGMDDMQALLRALCEARVTKMQPQPQAGDSQWVQDTIQAINTMGLYPPGTAYTDNWTTTNIDDRRLWEIGQCAVDMCRAMHAIGGTGGDNRDPYGG